jgi:flagellar hook-length control protein FliK
MLSSGLSNGGANSANGFSNNIDALQGRDTASGSAAISLFSKDFQDLVAAQIEALDKTESGNLQSYQQLGELSADKLSGLLENLEALLDSYLQAQSEGKDLPLNGSELPAIAAQFNQAFGQLLSQLQQAFGAASPTSGANPANGIASQSTLLAQLAAFQSGFASTTNIDSQLNAINDKLSALSGQLGESAQASLAGLSQTINGLRAGINGTGTSQQANALLNFAFSPLADGQNFAVLPSEASAIAANRSASESADLFFNKGLLNKSLSANKTLSGNIAANSITANSVGIDGKALNGLDAGLPLVSTNSANSASALNALAGLNVAAAETTFKDAALSENSLFNSLVDNRSNPVSARGAAAAANSAAVNQALAGQTFNTQLELPLGHSQWGNQVLQRVALLTAQGIQAAEIHLNPAELGPMQVRVDQRQDSATVVFTSHHASTRDALEASLPRLRELFSAQGMDLVDVDINSGDQQPGTNGDSGIADGDNDNNNTSAGSGELMASNTADEDEATKPPQQTMVLHYGLVDAYA